MKRFFTLLSAAVFLQSASACPSTHTNISMFAYMITAGDTCHPGYEVTNFFQWTHGNCPAGWSETIVILPTDQSIFSDSRAEWRYICS